MKGIDSFSVAAGTILLIGGIALLIGGIFLFPLIFYGVIATILGIVILLTLRKQEHIEPIRSE